MIVHLSNIYTKMLRELTSVNCDVYRLNYFLGMDLSKKDGVLNDVLIVPTSGHGTELVFGTRA